MSFDRFNYSTDYSTYEPCDLYGELIDFDLLYCDETMLEEEIIAHKMRVEKEVEELIYEFDVDEDLI